MRSKKRVAIIGAGFAGLTAAYELINREELEICLFEKENKPGGLAVGFKHKNWKWSLEQAYHHLFTSDNFAINLAKELEIPVIFKRPITSTYIHNEIVQLDSPFSLIKYPFLPVFDKLKVAATLAYLKFNSNWQPFEKITAKEWLTKHQGEKAYQELWEPLFTGKFGKYTDQISMAWFWARIFKRSQSLGYIEGGFQTLAEKLAGNIISRGGKIRYNTPVAKIEYKNSKWSIQNNIFDYIICTTPMPVFIKSFPGLPQGYIQKYTQIEHLHALNLVLELKKPFLKNYWLNINDSSFPFLAVVEHTNFMDKKYYNNRHLLYVGNYLPRNHKFFQMSKQELFKLFIPYLNKINPSYDFDICTLSFELFTGPFAQPVITTNYSKILPPYTTPLPNLYIGNLDSVYPWDRGTNYAIELGKKLAQLIPY